LASRRTRLSTLLGLAAATAATLTVLPVASSHAEPKPTLQMVQQRIDALNAKIEMVNEDFAGSRLELAAASRRASVAAGRVRVAQAALTATQRSMAAFAAAAYRNGGADQFVQLVSTSTPQTFLDRAAALDRIAASQSSQLAAAATARHRLEQVQAEAAAEKDAQTVIATRMAKQKQTIETALASQQELLRSLKADEQRRLRALQQAARARDAAAARASRSRTVTTTATYNGPASGRAGIAVQEAYAQLGKPYQWAAAGPDRFDCSGLTMWVWGKAGVSLPHQSRAQYAGGRKVAKSDLQPGDLTFYGSPIHHVGIYIGNGQMISAPQTGDVVKIQNALRSDYVGAVRP
jgi:cell wall-associated NlpC family hydrolase